MYRVDLFTSQEAQAVAASSALNHRLFVPRRWELNAVLKSIKYGQQPQCVGIALAVDDDKPVGVTVLVRNHIQTFVRKDQRRKGIGSAMVREFEQAGLINELTFAMQGLRIGSVPFWHRNGISCS